MSFEQVGLARRSGDVAQGKLADRTTARTALTPGPRQQHAHRAFDVASLPLNAPLPHRGGPGSEDAATSPSTHAPPAVERDRPPYASSLAFALATRTAATPALMRSAGPEDEARKAFVARGLMPSADGQDFQSKTGVGGFNVKYDPAAGALICTLRVGFRFVDGLGVSGGAVVAAQADFGRAAALLNANNGTETARNAAVDAGWRWGGSDKADFMDGYATLARNTWSQRHYFVSDRWADLFADVILRVDAHSAPADAPVPGDHCLAVVYKVPEGFSLGVGGVRDSPGDPHGANATFTSAQLGPTRDFLNASLRFETGSPNLAKAKATKGLNLDPRGYYFGRRAPGSGADVMLSELARYFQPGRQDGGSPILVTGRASTLEDDASTLEDDAKALSQLRADAVKSYLAWRGVARISVEAVGAQGATDDESFQRVDIRVGGGIEQRVLAHETGHMLGLDEEYATTRLAGTLVRHNKRLEPMGGGVQGAVAEGSDNVMAFGNVVRAQHYITYLEALNTVAKPEHFSYGGAGHSPKIMLDRPALPGDRATTRA